MLLRPNIRVVSWLNLLFELSNCTGINMYALKIPESQFPVNPVLVHTDGRPELILKCLYVDIVANSCGLFMYGGSLYIFIVVGAARQNKCRLRMISEDGKTSTLLSGDGMHRETETVRPCIQNIYVLDGIVQIQYNSYHYTINMDNNHTITRVDNIFGITPSSDGRLRACSVDYSGKFTLCKQPGVDGMLHITCPPGYLAGSIIIADNDIVYMYLGHRRIIVWPDSRCAIDPSDMYDVTAYGPVHVGMKVGCRVIVVWNPSDNTTYHMPLGDTDWYHRVSF
jgi:hypothetical protein